MHDGILFVVTIPMLLRQYQMRGKQERHHDVVRESNTRGRKNRETGETVMLMAAQF